MSGDVRVGGAVCMHHSCRVGGRRRSVEGCVAYLLELLIEPRDEAILREVPMAH